MSFAFRTLSLTLALTALAGCSTFDKPKEPPPCPMVSILGDAAKMTRFRPGQGRDLTDIQVEAEFVSYHGSCKYDDDKKVMTVTMQVGIDAQLGAANHGRKSDIAYFVAMPAFHPKPQAKLTVPVALTFPDGTDRVRYTDEEVEISFPIADIKQLPRYEIFLGLQLEPAELEYNRAQRGRQ